jgi:tRNA dimethylallyltransferase
MNLVVLLGQTCSGKSQMVVDLAKYLGSAWVVNCDSRQVYKRLDIGTAKVLGSWQMVSGLGRVFVYQGVSHFLIDFVDPRRQYSLADYLIDWVTLFNQADELPEYVILTGGTGLFAKGVYEEYQLTKIRPEFAQKFEGLRVRLNQLKLEELQENLDNAQDLNQSDRQNPRRLINRILEIEAKKNGWVESSNLDYPQFERKFLMAIDIDQELLSDRIKQRVDERIEQGLLAEVQNLQDLGTSRLLELGLEYRLTQLYLLGQISEFEWKEKLYLENWRYAKRQMTWLKKQSVIWFRDLEELKTNLRR